MKDKKRGKMKKWLIRKLGGITPEYHERVVDAVRKENIEKLVDNRLRGGNSIAVITKEYENSLDIIVEKLGINRINITKVNKLTHTITLYNGTSFRIFVSDDRHFDKNLKGLNFSGYIYI